MQRTSRALALARGALWAGSAELSSLAGGRSLTTNTDLKAVLQEKIPVEQVRPLHPLPCPRLRMALAAAGFCPALPSLSPPPR